MRPIAISYSLFLLGLVWSLPSGLATARVRGNGLMVDENHCPPTWIPLYGPETPAVKHRGVWFDPSSATQISPDSLKIFNGDWELNHAWYQFTPAPLRSINLLVGPSPERQYLHYRLDWIDPEAEMACRWFGNNWNLIVVKTRGETSEYSEDRCDDQNVPGCEPEGGGSNPPPQPNSPLGGAPQSTGRWVCDVYYEFDQQTGEILYWTILQCYEN